MASKEAILISGTKKKVHQAQMPLKLAERIIKYCSNNNEIILDPFMGSGTTAVVAKKLGRHFIGSEMNPEYVKMAEERVRQIEDDRQGKLGI